MTDVAQFHNLAHIYISLFGALLLLAIYYNIRKRFRTILEEDESQKRVDKGLLYLSLAMMMWVGSGLSAYISREFGLEDAFLYILTVNLISIANNLFLLLALFYFQYAPPFIYDNKKGVKIIMVITIAVAILTLIISTLWEQPASQIYNLRALPDLILSGFLSWLLFISLYNTFIHRGLKVVAYISAVVVLLMFASQLPEVFVQLQNSFTPLLLKVVSKTSLIFIFLVLATTWVIQLANTPRPSEMKIHFMDWSLIKLTIPSKGINQATVDFSSKTTQFTNLLKFAVRRKYAQAEMQSILVGSSGEIKSQTYVTRIIENINEILKLEPENTLDRKDLFTFLGEGKYRIRMLPDDISIDEGLLQEFVGNAKNQDYSTITGQ